MTAPRRVAWDAATDDPPPGRVARSSSRSSQGALPPPEERGVLLPADGEFLVFFADIAARAGRIGYALRAVRQALAVARAAENLPAVALLERAENAACAACAGQAPVAALVRVLARCLESADVSRLADARTRADGSSL